MTLVMHYLSYELSSLFLLFNCLAKSVTGFARTPSSTNWCVLSCSRSSLDEENDQWDLLNRYHLGIWRGTWETYGYKGDVIDSVRANVFLEKKTADGKNTDDDILVSRTHEIELGKSPVMGSTQVKSIPIGFYKRGDMGKTRFIASGLVVGPSVLRSGAISTEIGLVYGDGRIRVVCQHVPVWDKDVEPGSCPPLGLKLLRMTVCREATRPRASTLESERLSPPPPEGNPSFFHSVPRLQWHKRWSGKSWIWDPAKGNRENTIKVLDDAWHSLPRKREKNVWSMRMKGGILVQVPKMLTWGGAAENFRLAWLTEGKHLSRIKANILMPHRLGQEAGAVSSNFLPPQLENFQCDILKMTGDLEDETSEVLRNLKPEELDAESLPDLFEESGDMQDF